MGHKVSRALITGGAGFVGANYAKHLLDRGVEVVVYDNFGRGPGGKINCEWLSKHPNANKLKVVEGDVRDFESLKKAASGCDFILHAAAQVSVPLSMEEPKVDFEINVLGTFNVLEVARSLNTDPVVIYTSTNKVYGIPEYELVELETRYDFADDLLGVDEKAQLKAEEPYGASKAVGDLYMKAYHNIYGLKTISFRCSCMYGPRQWGVEEQGWVAWFCTAFALGYTITIFGNGKQVRDLLYITDVVEAFDLALDNIDKVAGLGINLGGGRENAVSLLEVIAYLEQLSGRKVDIRFTDWRPFDNKCYYTDITLAKKLLGWVPKVSWRDGIRMTYEWVKENLKVIEEVYRSKEGRSLKHLIRAAQRTG